MSEILKVTREKAKKAFDSVQMKASNIFHTDARGQTHFTPDATRKAADLVRQFKESAILRGQKVSQIELTRALVNGVKGLSFAVAGALLAINLSSGKASANNVPNTVVATDTIEAAQPLKPAEEEFTVDTSGRNLIKGLNPVQEATPSPFPTNFEAVPVAPISDTFVETSTTLNSTLEPQDGKDFNTQAFIKTGSTSDKPTIVPNVSSNNTFHSGDRMEESGKYSDTPIAEAKTEATKQFPKQGISDKAATPEVKSTPPASNPTLSQFETMKKEAKATSEARLNSIAIARTKDIPAASPTKTGISPQIKDISKTSQKIEISPALVSELAKDNIYVIGVPKGSGNSLTIEIDRTGVSTIGRSDISEFDQNKLKLMPTGSIILHSNPVEGQSYIRVVKDGTLNLINPTEINRIKVKNTATGENFSLRALQLMASPTGMNADNLSIELNLQGDKNALLAQIPTKNLPGIKESQQILDNPNTLGTGVSITEMMSQSGNNIKLSNPGSGISPKSIVALSILKYAKENLSQAEYNKIAGALIVGTQYNSNISLGGMVKDQNGVSIITGNDAALLAGKTGLVDNLAQFKEVSSKLAREAKARTPSILDSLSGRKPIDAITHRYIADKDQASLLAQDYVITDTQANLWNSYGRVFQSDSKLVKNTAGQWTLDTHIVERIQSDISTIKLKVNTGAVLQNAASTLLLGGINMGGLVTLQLNNTQQGSSTFTPTDPTMQARVSALRVNQDKTVLVNNQFSSSFLTNPLSSLIKSLFNDDPAASLVASQVGGLLDSFNPLSGIPLNISWSDKVTVGSSAEKPTTKEIILNPEGVIGTYAVRVLTTEGITDILAKHINDGDDVRVMEILKQKHGINISSEQAREIARMIPAIVKIVDGPKFTGPVGGGDSVSISPVAIENLRQRIKQNSSLISFAGVPLGAEEQEQFLKSLTDIGGNLNTGLDTLKKHEGKGRSVGDITRATIKEIIGNQQDAAAIIAAQRNMHNMGTITDIDFKNLEALYSRNGWTATRVIKQDVALSARVNGKTEYYLANTVGDQSNNFDGKVTWVKVPLNNLKSGVITIQRGSVLLVWDPGCGQFSGGANADLKAKMTTSCFSTSVCLTASTISPMSYPGTPFLANQVLGGTTGQVERTASASVSAMKQIQNLAEHKFLAQGVLDQKDSGLQLLALKRASQDPLNKVRYFQGVQLSQFYANLYNMDAKQRLVIAEGLKYMQVGSDLVDSSRSYNDSLTVGITPGFSSNSKVIEKGSVTQVKLLDGSTQITTKGDRISNSSATGIGFSISYSQLTEADVTARITAWAKAGFACKVVIEDQLVQGSYKRYWKFTIGGAGSFRNETSNQSVVVTNIPGTPPDRILNEAPGKAPLIGTPATVVPGGPTTPTATAPTTQPGGDSNIPTPIVGGPGAPSILPNTRGVNTGVTGIGVGAPAQTNPSSPSVIPNLNSSGSNVVPVDQVSPTVTPIPIVRLPRLDSVPPVLAPGTVNGDNPTGRSPF